MWEALFDECRKFEGEWRRTVVGLKKTTASQLASDIRNAHHREVVKSRLKGLRPEERWDAAWGPDGDIKDADGELSYFIWIRYLGKDAK